MLLDYVHKLGLSGFNTNIVYILLLLFYLFSLIITSVNGCHTNDILADLMGYSDLLYTPHKRGIKKFANYCHKRNQAIIS